MLCLSVSLCLCVGLSLSTIITACTRWTSHYHSRHILWVRATLYFNKLVTLGPTFVLADAWAPFRTLALSFIKWHPSGLQEVMRTSNFLRAPLQERHLMHILYLAKQPASPDIHGKSFFSEPQILPAKSPVIPVFLSAAPFRGHRCCFPHSPSPVWTPGRSYHMFL